MTHGETQCGVKRKPVQLALVPEQRSVYNTDRRQGGHGMAWPTDLLTF